MAVTTTESTQVRLLDAAERLIGERGVDAVSLRAINAEADSNVAAAHYHFGSKEALVRAVLDRRMAVLAEERTGQLAPLESEPEPSAREVASVFVRPLFELARDEQGARYVRFLAALYRAGSDWFPVLADAFAPRTRASVRCWRSRRPTSTTSSAPGASISPARPCSACSPTPTATAVRSTTTATATR